MSDQSFGIDYSGARGSNTGDEFHELWATRQALRLLDASTGLTAITVEGMTVAEGRDRVWDGVDCAAFFGGETAAEADRVDFQQMKYSAADAIKNWTVARFVTGRDGKASTSPLRRLAVAYQALIKARPSRPADSVQVSLVTNQPIAQDLLDAIAAGRVSVPTAYQKAWKPGEPDLHRLVHASGLGVNGFQRLAAVLDLQGSSGSRFEIEDQTLKAIAAWTDTEFVESTAQLRGYVRKRMMPEAAGEIITRERVLLQIGVSDGRSLFPCPSGIKEIDGPVQRGIARTIADRMEAGAHHLCVHGSGGVGKTTLLQEVESLLPAGSLMLKFDCYGGGSYQDASSLRHRPQDAFVQLANELAQRLRLPMLTPPRAAEDHPRLFRRRLELAAATLAQIQPNALLVIAVDAADNSVTAAQSRTPPERSFVHDLMSFEGLPTNARILISARTGRLEDLALPTVFEGIPLPGFDQMETGLNVSRYWDAAPEEWVEDFHHLSGGVPRVQAYAFEAAESNPQHAIDALRPVGKKLDQIFREQFQVALRKAGRQSEVQLLCAGLIALPRPIPISELTPALDASASQVVDVCSDLAPGVRLYDDHISFADEDFEDFVRKEAGDAVTSVLTKAADRLSEHATTSAYAALNVAPVLLAAGRGAALLDLVEQEPEPPVAVMPDPVRRREVLVQRLQAAIKVCQDAGDIARALRFVLIGADAKGTDHATRKLMTKYPGLTARYAAETAGRVILGDPEAIPDHGPLLCGLISEDARRGDGISAREDRRRWAAWLGARWDTYQEENKKFGHAQPWSVSPDDIAAIVYGTFVLHGVDTALARYGHIRPDAFHASTLRKLVAQLLAEGRASMVEDLAAKIKPAWAVFVYVPLAMAGRPVDLARLTEGLAILKRRFGLGADWLRHVDYGQKHRPAVIDIVLSAAEILVASGARSSTTEAVFAPFRDTETRRLGRLYDFDVSLLDAILRSCTLADEIAGIQTTVDTVFIPRLPAADDKRRHRSDEDRTDRGVKDVTNLVLGFYTLRARILSAGKPDAVITDALAKAQRHFESERWRIQSRPSALDIRFKVSECLTVLVAAGTDPITVMETAVELRGGWSPYHADASTRLFERLAAIPLLHQHLAQVLTQSVQATKEARIGAEEKAEGLATFAQFLAAISPADAEVVFKDAIHAASELDQEIAHQLRLVGQLVDRGLPAFGDRRRPCAHALTEVVHDAAVRLEHNEFRWFDSFTALARLDLPVALAAAARWSDTDRAQLHDSLRPLTTVGLDNRQLSVPEAAALFGLMVKPDGDHLTALVERAGQDGPNTAAQLAEEWASDLLVDRIGGFEGLSQFITKHGQGPSTDRLAAQIKLGATLAKAAEAQVSPQETERSPNTRQSRDILDAHVWTTDDLLDAQRLVCEIEGLINLSQAAEQYPREAEVFQSARTAVPFARRLDHLKALAGMRGRVDVADAVLAALSDWSSQPAIKRWAIDNLPALIVEELPDFARWLPWEKDKRLAPAFAFAEIESDQIQTLLLKGIARHADDLAPNLTFALIELIGAQLQECEAAALAQWYVERLKGRIAPIHFEGPSDAEIPATASEALGRFLYAHLSDVDVRVRWRAAHCLRRLARFGRDDIVAAVVGQADRSEETAFRDPEAPFYALAARLWLVIALDRIAGETPCAVAPHGARLLSIALDETMPHLLIRAYAADACNKLVAQGLLTLKDDTAGALAAVNRSPRPRSTDRVYRQPSGRFIDDDPKARFRFDPMDTVPYWFDPWLRVFEGVTTDDFKKEAERWVVDQWGVEDEGTYGSKEPRSRRFNDRNYNLTSNRHGAEPVLERHRRYLEWHAMWCTAGTLLQTHKLAPIEWDEDPFVCRLERGKLTIPPVWLADLAGPTPLEPRYWRGDRTLAPNWYEAVSNADFLKELQATDHPNYVVVDAYTDAQWLKSEQTAKVNTGLVSPGTAHALARALQSCDDPHDFYLCPEGHNLEIDNGEFSLRGWLQRFDMDASLDDADVYRNGVRRIETVPGAALTAALALERRLTPRVAWWRAGAEQPALIYEEWGGREPEDERRRTFGETVTTRGHRLLIREEDLQVFLIAEKRDLIAEVEITRSERPDRSPTYDEEGPQSTTFDRLLLFRSNGRLQAAECDLGAWVSNRPGT